MLVRHHEPLGNRIRKRENPLPDNWEELVSRVGDTPKNFGIVEQGRLYRSGIVWPHHVRPLKEKYGIGHFISLMEGDWLSQFYDNPSISIHQFPISRRDALTFERVKNIVDAIDGFDEPAIVFCRRGATRTGMVCAGYQIIHGRRTRLGAVLENMAHWNFNLSSIREILRYTANTSGEIRNGAY